MVLVKGHRETVGSAIYSTSICIEVLCTILENCNTRIAGLISSITFLYTVGNPSLDFTGRPCEYGRLNDSDDSDVFS